MNRRCAARAAQAGFSLIEVLVSILVISVGMLGVAALQTRSTTLNTDAYYRTQAQNLVTDLSERMRASWRTTARGGYVQDLDSLAGANCDLSATGGGSDGARAEYACWLGTVERTFGAASLAPRIVRNPENDDYADVTLGWPDRSLREADECNARATGANNVPVREWDENSDTCFTLLTLSVLM